jgi:hypothetical protein
MVFFGTACNRFTEVMLPLELDSILPGRSRGGQSCSALCPARSASWTAPVCCGHNCNYPYSTGLSRRFGPSGTSNLTKISCGLGLAADSIQPRRGAPCSTARTSPTVRSAALPATRRPEAPCMRRSHSVSMAQGGARPRTDGEEANAENPNLAHDPDRTSLRYTQMRSLCPGGVGPTTDVRR